MNLSYIGEDVGEHSKDISIKATKKIHKRCSLQRTLLQLSHGKLLLRLIEWCSELM